MNSLDISESNLSFLTSSPLALKVACVVISILCIVFLIFFLFKTKWLKFALLYDLYEFFTLKIYGTKKARRCWGRIARKVNRGKLSSYDKVVIKADKIFHKLLVDLIPLYETHNFEERLRKVGLSTFSEPKKLWEAHLFCENKLMTNEYRLEREEALGMLKIYEQALIDLGILEKTTEKTSGVSPFFIEQEAKINKGRRKKVTEEKEEDKK